MERAWVRDQPIFPLSEVLSRFDLSQSVFFTGLTKEKGKGRGKHRAGAASLHYGGRCKRQSEAGARR